MLPFNSETEFTGWLARKSAGKARGLHLGIGDDAALLELRPGFKWVVTTDLSIEQVHFSADRHPPRSVGHRALARSLSDVAAMGGEPRFALISLALSRRVRRRWIEEFFTGMLRLARRYRVKLVGGDTALHAGRTMVDVTVIGEVLRDRAILRSGAKPGDFLFVGGELGYSALGLRLLRSRAGSKRFSESKAIRAHLYPDPQCQLGAFLAGRRIASSAIDVSDGLSSDLNRLAQASGVGARIWADRIPRPESAGGNSARSPGLSLALHGGEDYKLLFTVPPGRVELLPKRFRATRIVRIGEMQASRLGVQLVRNGNAVPLEAAGYDHFRSGKS
ncbi:MAG TPA: thiamine-phosphate kinase [Terriglobia bacterium]|nr:thiamine-phosphate kinase [Terriglobia bacterium]